MITRQSTLMTLMKKQRKNDVLKRKHNWLRCKSLHSQFNPFSQCNQCSQCSKYSHHHNNKFLTFSIFFRVCQTLNLNPQLNLQALLSFSPPPPSHHNSNRCSLGSTLALHNPNKHSRPLLVLTYNQLQSLKTHLV